MGSPQETKIDPKNGGSLIVENRGLSERQSLLLLAQCNPFNTDTEGAIESAMLTGCPY